MTALRIEAAWVLKVLIQLSCYRHLVLIFFVYCSLPNTEIEFPPVALMHNEKCITWKSLKTFRQHWIHSIAIYKCFIISLINFHQYAAFKLLLWLLFFSSIWPSTTVTTHPSAEP